jgi:hypothetical protein
MAGCDISDSDGVLLLLLGVADAECDAASFFLRVCGLVAGRGVDRLETIRTVSSSLYERRAGLLLADEVAEVGNRVLRIADKLAFGLSSVELFSFYV